METVFGINMVALRGRPAAPAVAASELLDAFLRHRREVVTRRTIFELRKARERAPSARGSGGRARQHRRDHRADQGERRHPAEAQAALMARVLASGAVPQMLERAGAVAHAARRPRRRNSGCSRRRLPTHRGAGAGHPRHAPAAPDRPRAGQDRQRSSGELLDAHRRPVRNPRAARSACSVVIRAELDRDPRHLRRHAPHRDHAATTRPHASRT